MSLPVVASPYQPGVKLTIHAHTPPPPFSSAYRNRNYRDIVYDTVNGHPLRMKISRLELAMAHPPLETPPPAEAKSQVLTILGGISHRLPTADEEDRGGACLVRCRLDSDPSYQIAAKIYDGVFYPAFPGVDCMYSADSEYSSEAAAYSNIPPSLQGSIAPRYLGSWTFALDVADVADTGREQPTTGSGKRTRWVRLILIEHLNGECMYDVELHAMGLSRATVRRYTPSWKAVNPQLLPKEADRLEVMARIIEAATLLSHAGITHKDIAPRNIMLLPRASNPARIVIIDFGWSVVKKLHPYLSLRPEGERPESPIERFWSYPLYSEFFYWFPQSWVENGFPLSRDKAREWLCARFGLSEESDKFEPLSQLFVEENIQDPSLERLLAAKPSLRAATTLQEDWRPAFLAARTAAMSPPAQHQTGTEDQEQGKSSNGNSSGSRRSSSDSVDATAATTTKNNTNDRSTTTTITPRHPPAP